MKRFKKGKNCKISKNSVYIDPEVTIGDNVEIFDNVYVKGKSVIKSGAKIFSGTEIRDSTIGENCEVKYSIIENSEIGENNSIGPFARIRPGTKTACNVKIGNFVEIKNSIIGSKSKINHLAYVGDAEVGENVNIGCGAIFVNYNGKIKQKSVVGDRAFIGSNCNIIAPVIIGEGAYICAGTTITKNVSKDSFVIGRLRQEEKLNGAKIFFEKN